MLQVEKVYLLKFLQVWVELIHIQMQYLIFIKIILEKEYLQEKVYMM